MHCILSFVYIFLYFFTSFHFFMLQLNEITETTKYVYLVNCVKFILIKNILEFRI